MRILQVNNYHYLRGGSEKMYLETAALLEEKGHEIQYFSVRDKQSIPTKYDKYFVEPPNYNNKLSNIIVKIKDFVRFLYSCQSSRNLDKLLHDKKPDVAHLHIFYGRLTSSILKVFRKHKVPVVMTVHEYRMLCPVYVMYDNDGNVCNKCARGNYIHCIIKKCNQNSFMYSLVSAIECKFRDLFYNYIEYIDRFIMVSKFIEMIHCKNHPEIKNKSSQIYNFVTSVENNDNTSVTKSDSYYLYYGRLSREKGILGLIETWKEFPQLDLKIVGSGPLLNEICCFIKSNNISNVEIIGYKSGAELTKIIKKAKYTIVPSEWYESFGLTIAESYMCSTPVIGADIGAIPELVLNNETGFLFNPADNTSLSTTIKKTLSIDEDQYIAISKNALKFSQNNFNKDIYYEKLMKVYNSVINNEY